MDKKKIIIIAAVVGAIIIGYLIFRGDPKPAEESAEVKIEVVEEAPVIEEAPVVE